jgi:hypothetical protein
LATCKYLAIAGGLVFVALVVMSIVSITGRKLFSWPVPGDVAWRLRICYLKATNVSYWRRSHCSRHCRDDLPPRRAASAAMTPSLRALEGWCDQVCTCDQPRLAVLKV